jgi:hypothetical protein
MFWSPCQYPQRPLSRSLRHGISFPTLSQRFSIILSIPEHLPEPLFQSFPNHHPHRPRLIPQTRFTKHKTCRLSNNTPLHITKRIVLGLSVGLYSLSPCSTDLVKNHTQGTSRRELRLGCPAYDLLWNHVPISRQLSMSVVRHSITVHVYLFCV